MMIWSHPSTLADELDDDGQIAEYLGRLRSQDRGNPDLCPGRPCATVVRTPVDVAKQLARDPVFGADRLYKPRVTSVEATSMTRCLKVRRASQ